MAAAGLTMSSSGTWGLGVWIDCAGVGDSNAYGLAVGFGVRGGGVCDAVRAGVRPGSVVSVPTDGAAVGEDGPVTVASLVDVGVLVLSCPVGAGVRLAVGLAVSDGPGGVCVGPWVGGGLVDSRVGTDSVGPVVGGVAAGSVGVMVGMV